MSDLPQAQRERGQEPQAGEWVTTSLGEVLPLKYGKAKGDTAGYPRKDTAAFGSNGAFSSVDRALTIGPAIVIGRKGAAGAIHYSPDPCWPTDTAYFAEGSSSTYLPFFRYLLEGVGLNSLDRSTAIPSLSRDDYNSIPVAYPASREEQARIVGLVEERLSRLDAGTSGLRRAQANLKRYRASVLKAACEGRLVPTEADLARQEGRDYETGEQLLGRIIVERPFVTTSRASCLATRRTVPCSDDVPKGWVATSLGEAFEVCIGATPSRAKPEYWGGDIPWVSSGEVAFCRIRSSRERITPAGLQNTSTALHPAGTVLIGMIGEGKTRGQVAILDIAASNNQNSAAIRIPPKNSVPEFVYYFLYGKYESNRRAASGNNQPALNKSRVKAMSIPLPPLAEQERIVAEVERRLSVADALEATITANLRRATRLRQSILKKAFSGGCPIEEAVV